METDSLDVHKAWYFFCCLLRDVNQFVYVVKKIRQV